VDIQADSGADVLRERAAYDEDASRLGEVALVDREGRIGTLGTTFYNTLLDENAASHIALGNAYEITVGPEDVPNINKSAIHVDFMIGDDDVQVTGITRTSDRKSTRLNSSHGSISYAVFCLKKKKPFARSTHLYLNCAVLLPDGPILLLICWHSSHPSMRARQQP